MYSMWNAHSDMDYYGQFNPEPPEDEEPEIEEPEIPVELQAHWGCRRRRRSPVHDGS